MGLLSHRALPWSKEPPKPKAHVVAFIDKTPIAEQERLEAAARQNMPRPPRRYAEDDGREERSPRHSYDRDEPWSPTSPSSSTSSWPDADFHPAKQQMKPLPPLPPRPLGVGAPKYGIIGKMCPRIAKKGWQEQSSRYFQLNAGNDYRYPGDNTVLAREVMYNNNRR